jgi:hypothetical protein
MSLFNHPFSYIHNNRRLNIKIESQWPVVYSENSTAIFHTDIEGIARNKKPDTLNIVK